MWRNRDEPKWRTLRVVCASPSVPSHSLTAALVSRVSICRITRLYTLYHASLYAVSHASLYAVRLRACVRVPEDSLLGMRGATEDSTQARKQPRTLKGA